MSPEPLLAIAALALGLAAARFRWRWLAWWERPLARLARHKRLAILLAALAPLVLRALLLPWYGVPQPRIHDEFSFLLAADTFLHGRLVNPQHPFWPHFESEHILVRPVYASAFPIAPAAALAAGRLLWGHPWAGVWLSMGLMCGAICWMLQGWAPPRWALLGAALAVLRIGVSSYWMNTYWGGCVAAAGGALVLGALPRIMRAPRWRTAAVMALGLAILAHSRPVEGAFLGAAVAVWLFDWMLGRGHLPWGVTLRHVVLPLVLLLAVTALGTGYYFARVTGKPWVAPYVLYRDSVSIAPHFLWQKPGPEPLYDSQDVRHFYVYWEMLNYRESRQLLRDFQQKVSLYWHFYLGPILTIPLVTLPLLWRTRIPPRLLLMVAVCWLALAGQVWHNAHYAAPATGLMVLIVILGMRYLRAWRWRGHAVGLYVVRALPPACAAMLLLQVMSGPAPAGPLEQRSWRWPQQGGMARAQLVRQLRERGEQNLIFVRYGRFHNLGDEWIYNDADIDHAPVIWARELDRSSNAALMRYFAGRRVWLVDPDTEVPHLVPYADAPPRAMPFVQVGAPGIAVLREPAQLRRAVLEKLGATADTLQSCYVWDFYFTDATGVAGPGVTPDCSGGEDLARKVSFDHWFEWLQRQT